MEKCNFLSTVISFVRNVSLLTYCFKRSHKDIHEDINALSQNVTKISFFFSMARFPIFRSWCK